MWPDIFEFLDYQEYLRACFSAEKARDRLFSYRVFASCVGMDASLLVKILQGKRHLSQSGCKLMRDFLKLDARADDYFQELVAYSKAEGDAELRLHFERLLSLRPACAHRIEADCYRYFQFWYYPALRSSLDVMEYRHPLDAELLGSRFKPTLRAEQVQEAMEVLQRLGLVRPDTNGRWIPATAHLSTGERWQSAAVREYQRQLSQLAAESLVQIPPKERDISTLTMALDSRQLEKIRAVLQEARQSIVRHADSMPSSDCDVVYQLNIQFFPLMRCEKDRA